MGDSKPVRLQLSRKKGFDLQGLSWATNGLPAAGVARSSQWGNPFTIGAYRCYGHGFEFHQERINDAATAVRFFAEMLTLEDRNYPSNRAITAKLRGKNLACWCKLDAPCHADVLLDLANASQGAS